MQQGERELRKAIEEVSYEFKGTLEWQQGTNHKKVTVYLPNGAKKTLPYPRKCEHRTQINFIKALRRQLTELSHASCS